MAATGSIPTLHDQGVVPMGSDRQGVGPRTVQGRSALYINQTRWPTAAGDILGPFYLFSFNANRGPQLYLYLKANDDWYLYTTGINDAYMREWVRRVGWRQGIISQSALNAMALDLRDRVGRAVEGSLAQVARAAQVTAQESRAYSSTPGGGIGTKPRPPAARARARGAGGAGALPTWVRPVGAAAAVILGAMWWGQRGKRRRR